MIDNLKKYWFLYGVVLAFATWLITINSRIYDSPEQKVEHENHVKNSLTPVQQAEAKLSDKLNNEHAIEIRQMRYQDSKTKDSLKVIYDRKKDSTTLDYIKRFTVQIEKTNEKIDNIHN